MTESTFSTFTAAESVPGFFDIPPATIESQLRADLVAMIRARSDATPRNMQKRLGPSDVAHPCMRKLAYALMDVPRVNPTFDPLPSIIGTATHSWLETAAGHANVTLGRVRWLSEAKVSPAPWLTGHSDMYDTDTDCVVDWKILGTSTFKKNKRRMSQLYVNQLHLYGKGFKNAGRDVKHVAIFVLPRGGLLNDAHLWTEPFDESIADASLERHDQVVALLNDLEIDKYPERYEWIAKSGPSCVFCPQYAPNPLSPLHCPGAGDD